MAFLKLFFFALNVVWIVCVQPLVMLVTKGRGAYVLPRLWHFLCCKVFGIKVRVVGQPAQNRQVMYMANHISYLDIPVLGSVIKGSFVAKQDVEGWALFGFLSKLQQTAFISRDRAAAKRAQADLDAMLTQGKDLIIFPEGTSTDGRDVFPFKSSLFSLVLGSKAQDLVVQPVTVSVVSADGRDLTPESSQEDVDIYAWHLNMETELDEHLLAFAKTRGAEIEVRFHEPLEASAYTDRKLLAKDCHAAVKSGLRGAGMP